MKKILLDANAIISFLEEDSGMAPFEHILAVSTVCYTPISAHIVAYFLEKGRVKFNYKAMIDFFSSALILTSGSNLFKTALTVSKGEDIEDGMQVAYCLENDVQIIITADAGLYAKYSNLLEILLLN